MRNWPPSEAMHVRGGGARCVGHQHGPCTGLMAWFAASSSLANCCMLAGALSCRVPACRAWHCNMVDASALLVLCMHAQVDFKLQGEGRQGKTKYLHYEGSFR